FQDLLAGLCVGGVVAVCFLLGQLLEVHSFFFMNLNPFWHYVGRYPATFSDPNAFGVMTMLIVPALIGCAIGSRGPIYAFVAVLLLCFSIWSGSRTMYLGLVVWGIMYLHFLVKRTNRKELLYALWIGAAFFTVFVFLLGYPSVNEKLQSSLPFPSTVRVLKTIHWSEAEGMLFSRRTYSKIAYHTWQKSPMTGIGLERFFSEQRRIMKSLNIDLGQWRDNANNYYLQVLAEEGVLGLALLLFSIALFGFALLSTERKVLLESTQVEPAFVERGFFVTRSLMFVIALVLMTGPHVNFPEVRYLVMVMLAVSASRPIVIRTSFLNVIRVVSLMLALLFPPLFALSVSRGVEKTHSTGFYSAEEVSGRMAAWTSDRARLHLCDVYSDRVRLRLRAGNPDIASRPLRIALFERDPRDTGALDLTNLHPVRVKLTTGEWTEVEVPITSDFRAYRKVIELRAERVWNPREAKMGDDPRVLGVMVELPESMC
ncbi:MAG: O-antigen ligase family protein, partial [Deltaproteobacteria bacterium]|nr:O-antigen ligase family protein [Deltaproteobacteria bacterium]